MHAWDSDFSLLYCIAELVSASARRWIRQTQAKGSTSPSSCRLGARSGEAYSARVSICSAAFSASWWCAFKHRSLKVRRFVVLVQQPTRDLCRSYVCFTQCMDMLGESERLYQNPSSMQVDSASRMKPPLSLTKPGRDGWPWFATLFFLVISCSLSPLGLPCSPKPGGLTEILRCGSPDQLEPVTSDASGPPCMSQLEGSRMPHLP